MRVLRRPMFRGSVPQRNEGIMDGLVDRKGYEHGTDNPYMKEAMEAFRHIKQPRDTSLSQMLISGGLNTLSGQSAGGGTLANLAGSFKKPSEEYMAAQVAKEAFPSKMEMAATEAGLKQKWAMDVAKAKASGSGMQKDYSAKRNYRDFLLEFSKPPKDRYSTTVYNIFAPALAEYASYIQENAYKSEEGARFMQQVDGILPSEIKSGQAQWQYDKMDAGAFYFHPGLKAFVQREPKTEDTPEQLIVIDPYTFKEVRRQNLE